MQLRGAAVAGLAPQGLAGGSACSEHAGGRQEGGGQQRAVVMTWHPVSAPAEVLKAAVDLVCTQHNKVRGGAG